MKIKLISSLRKFENIYESCAFNKNITWNDSSFINYKVRYIMDQDDVSTSWSGFVISVK